MKATTTIIALLIAAVVAMFVFSSEIAAWQQVQKTEAVVKYCANSDGKIDLGIVQCKRYVLGTLTAEDKVLAQAEYDKKAAAYRKAKAENNK